MARHRSRTEFTTPLGGAGSAPPLQHIPFPGLIDENPWIVREGRWPTFINREDVDGEGAVMQVPLGNDDVSLKLRLHEQAHVAWSPDLTQAQLKAIGVEWWTIQACEDARIVRLMERADPHWKEVNKKTMLLPGVLVGKHAEDFKNLANKLARYDPSTKTLTGPNPPTPGITLLEAGRLVAASRGQAEAAVFDHVAKAAGMGWLVKAVNKMHSKWIGKKLKPTFEHTVAYAQELEQYFEDISEELGDMAQDIEAAGLEERMSSQLPSGMTPGISNDASHWGEMTIEHAPLTQILQGNPSRKTRATDMGAVPRYMHRLVTDQKIFGRKRKHRRFQGTVLIDHSGSMSLTPEEVDEILFRWPAVTIATYSGHHATTGVLRIVAKKGRRASVEWLDSPAGHDNAVDGPALDWLAKQKGPRVWISDGGVTGVGGHTPKLIADAAKKVRAGKIKRIENVQELLGR